VALCSVARSATHIHWPNPLPFLWGTSVRLPPVHRCCVTTGLSPRRCSPGRGVPLGLGGACRRGRGVGAAAERLVGDVECVPLHVRAPRAALGGAGHPRLHPPARARALGRGARQGRHPAYLSEAPPPQSRGSLLSVVCYLLCRALAREPVKALCHPGAESSSIWDTG